MWHHSSISKVDTVDSIESLMIIILIIEQDKWRPKPIMSGWTRGSFDRVILTTVTWHGPTSFIDCKSQGGVMQKDDKASFGIAPAKSVCLLCFVFVLLWCVLLSFFQYAKATFICHFLVFTHLLLYTLKLIALTRGCMTYLLTPLILYKMSTVQSKLSIC